MSFWLGLLLGLGVGFVAALVCQLCADSYGSTGRWGDWWRSR